MKTKKALFICLMLVLTISAIVAGCAAKEESVAPPPATEPAAEPAAEPATEPAEIDFPTKTITITVGWGSGGMADLGSRIVAAELEKTLGQPVVVVNKPGGDGYAAALEVLNADPDGYNILFIHSAFAGSMAIGGMDFSMDSVTPIGSFFRQQRVLVSKQDSPWTNFDEFIEYTKENAVKFGYCDQLTGSIIMAMADEAGIKLNPVPFSSGSEASAAIIGGHLDILEIGLGTPAWQAAKNGDLQILAMSTEGDLTEHGFPDVKTLTELGFTYEGSPYFGLCYDKDVPEEIQQKVAEALKSAVESADVTDKFNEMNVVPAFLDSAEFAEVLNNTYSEAKELSAYLK